MTGWAAPYRHHCGSSLDVSKPFAEQAHGALESQNIRTRGEISGTSSSEPAGMTISRPLRV
jgi:hypothetical protein